MITQRTTSCEQAVGFRSGWARLPILLGLLLPGTSGPANALAATIVAKGPPGVAEIAAEGQIPASRRQILVVAPDADQREAKIEPKLAKILPLKDTEVYDVPNFLAEPKAPGASERLVAGVRPADDIPPIGCPVTGRRVMESDWLLHGGNAAVWVTGVPAPAAGVPLVLIGTLVENERGVHLLATLVCRDSGPRKTPGHTLKPGEFLFFHLIDARSLWEEVKVDGDSVRVIDLGRSILAFEALRPGIAGVEVLQFQSWNEREQTTVARFEIKVLE